MADPVKDVPDIYDYRGMHASTSSTRSVISYHVDLASTPGPDNEYISIHRLNEYSINKLNSIRINLMIHLPNRSSVAVNVKFGDKIIDLKIKIFEKTFIPASDQYYLDSLSKVLETDLPLETTESLSTR